MKQRTIIGCEVEVEYQSPVVIVLDIKCRQPLATSPQGINGYFTEENEEDW